MFFLYKNVRLKCTTWGRKRSFLAKSRGKIEILSKRNPLSESCSYLSESYNFLRAYSSNQWRCW